MPADVEKRPFVEGYASLADFIVSDADRSGVIYRRFDRLAARNLLYLQTELVELEVRKDSLDAEDAARPADASAKDWALLCHQAEEGQDERAKERVDIAKKLRVKLKEYSALAPPHDSFQVPDPKCTGKTVLLEHRFNAIQSPSSRPLKALRNTFHHASRTRKRNHPMLGGRSQFVLDNQEDLLSLQTSSNADRLTRLLRRVFAVIFLVRTSPKTTSFSKEAA